MYRLFDESWTGDSFDDEVDYYADSLEEEAYPVERSAQPRRTVEGRMLDQLEQEDYDLASLRF